LAAFTSPLAALFATLDVANNYLLDSASNIFFAASWPGANFGITFGTPFTDPPNLPLLPEFLAQPALGGYSSVGVVSQFIDDGLPIISQLGYNGLDYLNLTGNALFVSGAELTQSLWTAAGLVLQGNIPAALSTISTAITDAGQLLLATGGYVLNNVIARATAVVGTLVGSLGTFLGATVLQAGLVANVATTVITNTVTALSLGNIEAAWNYAVDGLLGPGTNGNNSIPGTLLNLSIGGGVQYAPIASPDAAGIEAAYAPSTRTLVQGLVKGITADLQVSAPAAAAPALSAAAARADAVEAAPAAEAAAGEDSTGGSSAGGSDEAAPAAEAAPAVEAAPAAEAAGAEAAAETPDRKPARASRGAAARG
jgi:hypothetical protein